jgi:hypothetical protein
MDFDLLLLAQLYLFSVLIACAFVFQRLRWKRRKQRKKNNLGFYPSSTSLGNALHQLQSIVAPPMKHVVMQTLDEDDLDEQDTGDGNQNSAQRHLLKQAARIRRGENIELLTARAARR